MLTSLILCITYLNYSKSFSFSVCTFCKHYSCFHNFLISYDTLRDFVIRVIQLIDLILYKTINIAHKPFIHQIMNIIDSMDY